MSSTADTLYSDTVEIVGVRFRRRELWLIPAFWTLMAVFVSANRLLDQRGEGMRSVAPTASIKLAFAEALLWACLTPVVFWTVSRFGTDQTGRLTRVLVYAAMGLGVVMLVDTMLDIVRATVFPPPPPRRFGRPGLRAGWWNAQLRFSLLNEVVTYLGLLSAGIARDISIRFRARREETAVLKAELVEARLDALRRQLDPHFLFNTLNAISSLVERDPRGVRRMIARLSELLRHSMSASSDQLVTLEAELEVVDRYLEIMRIRFQGRLTATIDALSDVRGALVPSFALQPLVENALKHGIERITGPGEVRVSARRDDDMLVIAVRDNGPGLPSTATSTTGGVGLENTRTRLAGLYSGQASLVVRNVDGGAEAELRLPFREGTA